MLKGGNLTTGRASISFADPKTRPSRSRFVGLPPQGLDLCSWRRDAGFPIGSGLFRSADGGRT